MKKQKIFFSTMRSLLFTLFFCLHIFAAQAQFYPVSQIPDSLRQDVGAVYRYDDTFVTIHGKSQVTVKHNYAITILNARGDGFAHFQAYYSQLEEVVSYSAEIYDAKGKRIKKLGKKDFQDHAIDDGMSFDNDGRMKYADMRRPFYPYTVKVSITTRQNHTFYVEGWNPLWASASVQFSRYILRTSPSVPLNIKASFLEDFNVKFTESSTEKRWEIRNAKPVTDELFGGWNAPTVRLQAKKFSIAGYQGEGDSWQALGQFNNTLSKDLKALPEEAKNEVRAILDTLSSQSTEAKVAAVYRYMQQRTRYVGIQLGVGGWRPFSPAYVHERGYGDCKALSFYTKSLLESVGIPAHYTVINAGEDARPIDPDFPVRAFNHIILCVPVPEKQDTLWLECTSQSAPCGYLGHSTGNRRALVVTPEGGKLLPTQHYPAEHNATHRNLRLQLTENGHAHAQTDWEYVGISSEEIEYWKKYKSEKAQREAVYALLTQGEGEMDEFSLSHQAARLPKAQVAAKLRLYNVAGSTSSRLIFSDPFAKSYSVGGWSVAEEARRTPIFIRFGELHEDNIEVAAPQGYAPEHLPEAVEIETKYGSFSQRFEAQEDGKVKITRRFVLHDGHYLPEEFKAFSAFLLQTQKALKQRIVWKK